MSRPRLGFLGVGWIGRHRMEKMLETGLVEAVALADPSPEMIAEAKRHAPDAMVVPSLEGMLALDLDGVVIATPSALHAGHSIAALQAGAAVFCQKPLGRHGDEARAVVEAARKADRLLGLDLSYRHTAGACRIKEVLRAGKLGEVFAADLTFHNAYGPGKPWFFDKALSGGGCVIDLGVHLVDLALWLLDFPDVLDVQSHLFSGGKPLVPAMDVVEDYAVVTLTLRGNVVVRIACSWRVSAGCDAVIRAELYGTAGGAALRNVGGSFYDFTADHFVGTSATRLSEGPDEWGGRAAAAWARQLAGSRHFDPSAEQFLRSADVLDRVYAR